MTVRHYSADGGWLAPDGKFWQCEDYQHHVCARQIVGELGLEVTDYSAESTLEKANFVHLSLGSAYFRGDELTQAQRDVLFDLATLWPETWGVDYHMGILELLRGPQVRPLVTPYAFS